MGSYLCPLDAGLCCGGNLDRGDLYGGVVEITESVESDLMDKIDELEACPFCGGEGFLTEDDVSEYPADGKVWLATCLGSCAIAPGVYAQATREDAIRKWNTRSQTASQIEQLCDKHKSEFTVFHVGGCIKCWQENECDSRATVAAPPLDDYVTLLERNNGRLREVLKEALAQTGCDGDLCLYRWHEKARVVLGEEDNPPIPSPVAPTVNAETARDRKWVYSKDVMDALLVTFDSLKGQMPVSEVAFAVYRGLAAVPEFASPATDSAPVIEAK